MPQPQAHPQLDPETAAAARHAVEALDALAARLPDESLLLWGWRAQLLAITGLDQPQSAADRVGG